MNARLALIRQRRAMLQLRARAQRLKIETAAQPLSKPLRFADSIGNILNRLRRHPVMIGLTLVYLLSTPRNRFSIWAGRILSLWEIAQMMRNGRFNRPNP